MKKLSPPIIMVACAMAWAISIPASAQVTTTIQSTADTYIESGTPTINYGNAPILLVRQTDATINLTRASYVQFDLASLPAGTITSATLWLYGAHETTGTGVPVYAVPGTNTAAWSETLLNWNNAGATVGVDFAGTPLATTTVAGGAPAWYGWNVTAYINQRRTSGFTHATIAVATTTTHEYRVSFNSGEAATNLPGLTVITNTTPPPPPPPITGTLNSPMFGHDYNNSRASIDTNLNASNVAALTVERRITGSGVTGTPAVVDGVAYYGDFSGRVRAVNATTGAVLWNTLAQVNMGTVPPMLSPSPYVTADRVYIAGNAGWVYALNRATGAIVWSKQIELTPNSRISSSPMVVGNRLIIGTGSYQVFLPVPATPFRGRIMALDTVTGNTLWSTAVCSSTNCGSGVSVWSTAAIDTTLKLAYIGTGQTYTAPAGPLADAIVAINYETGVIAWSHQFTSGDVYNINTPLTDPNGKDHDVGAAPNLFTATVAGVSRQLVGVGDKGGRYKAFDRATGAVIWTTPVGLATEIGGVMHSSAYANGVIYLVSNRSNTGGGRNDAIPATATAYALNASTGAIIWSRATLPSGAQLPGGFGGVTVANGLMYFMTWDGQLRILNTTDGTILKSLPVGTAVGTYVPAPTDAFPNGSASGPVVYNGKVYVGFGWTWVAAVTGGLAVVSEPTQWTCPSGYVPVPGLNSNFLHGGVNRAFVLNLPTNTSNPMPVWVPLTGSVESTNENLTTRGGNAALTANGYVVIGAVRKCANQDPNGAGTAVNGGTCNAAGTGGWTWNPWNEGRVFAAAGDPWKTAEGPDSTFLEAVVRCVGTRYPLDKKRLFVGGISSGGTMTNRALTFNSDFWAGGMPISGEWYVTQSTGIAYPGTDEFAARRQAVINTPTAIFQGRVGPFPLQATLSPMVVITVWGGATDIWNCGPNQTPPLCADYRPSTQVASNYFSAQANVVHVACSSTHGHQWPTINRDAFNLWALNTLNSHPKGTAKSAFTLTTPPSGYSCKLGVFTDHY